jgi:hypothetical protein
LLDALDRLDNASLADIDTDKIREMMMLPEESDITKGRGWRPTTAPGYASALVQMRTAMVCLYDLDRVKARTLHTIGAILVATETRKVGTWRTPIAVPPSQGEVAEVGDVGEEEESGVEEEIASVDRGILTIEEDSAEEDEEIEASVVDDDWEDGAGDVEDDAGDDANADGA